MKYYYNLGTMFSDVASSNNNRPAIIYEECSYSYRDLDILSNQIAHYLINKGINKRDVIAIFNTKELQSYAVMIACLKIGAVYTNIDIDNPIERLKKIFLICEPKLIISDTAVDNDIEALLESLSVPFICREELDISIKEMNANLPSVTKDLSGNNPAYIMFTSGSTGTPKGVVISHANILSFIGWSTSYFSITDTDVFAQLSPMYFDNSVFDFYTALFSRASIVPIKKSTLQNPAELVNYVEAKSCTIWFSVPTLLVYLLSVKVLDENRLPRTRLFSFGGEAFPKKDLKHLFEIFSSRSELINVYGPTEGTCICSAHKISESDFNDMLSPAPLGRINPNFEYLIINGNQVVKTGEKGELCLIGTNVSSGYYNDIKRTEESFVQNILITQYNEKMYKTGDMVSIDEKGVLHFKGRKDNQIKHLGYRIELEEIEAAINGLEYIKSCAVVYKRVNERYGKIIAFITFKNDIVNEENIMMDLKAFLPQYMLPNVLKIRDFLPNNPNGKIDRKNLE